MNHFSILLIQGAHLPLDLSTVFLIQSNLQNTEALLNSNNDCSFINLWVQLKNTYGGWFAGSASSPPLLGFLPVLPLNNLPAVLRSSPQSKKGATAIFSVSRSLFSYTSHSTYDIRRGLLSHTITKKQANVKIKGKH